MDTIHAKGIAFAQREIAILDTAFELFQQRGIESATMEKIAEGAGIGKGTIYKHFTGKNEIFALLHIHRERDLVRRIHQIPKDLPVLVQIRRLIRSIWDAHTQDFKVFQVFRKCYKSMEPNELSPHIRQEFTQITDEKKNLARALFQRAIDEKIFKNTNVDTMILAAMGLYTGMLDMAMDEAIEPSEELYDLIERMVFKGFMG